MNLVIMFWKVLQVQRYFLHTSVLLKCMFISLSQSVKCVLLRYVDLYLTTLSLFHEQNAALLFHCIIVENKVFDQLKKALFLNKRSIKYLLVCLFKIPTFTKQGNRSNRLRHCRGLFIRNPHLWDAFYFLCEITVNILPRRWRIGIERTCSKRKAQSRQTSVFKTGIDSFTAKCSAVGVSVTGPQKWPS